MKYEKKKEKKRKNNGVWLNLAYFKIFGQIPKTL